MRAVCCVGGVNLTRPRDQEQLLDLLISVLKADIHDRDEELISYGVQPSEESKEPWSKAHWSDKNHAKTSG